MARSPALNLPKGKGNKERPALVVSSELQLLALQVFPGHAQRHSLALLPNFSAGIPVRPQTSSGCYQECSEGQQSSRLLLHTVASRLSEKRVFPGENESLLSFPKIRRFFISRSITVLLTFRASPLSPMRLRQHPPNFFSEKQILIMFSENQHGFQRATYSRIANSTHWPGCSITCSAYYTDQTRSDYEQGLILN